MNILGIFLFIATAVFLIWQTVSLVKDIRYRKKRKQEKSNAEHNGGVNQNNIGDKEI